MHSMSLKETIKRVYIVFKTNEISLEVQCAFWIIWNHSSFLDSVELQNLDTIEGNEPMVRQ